MKYFIVIVALLVGCRANACEVHYRADDAVTRVIKPRGFNIAEHGNLCDKLKSARAELVIQEWEGRIGDNEVAFANVWVANREESAFSSKFTNAVRYDAAGVVDQDDLLYATIAEAIEELTSKGQLDTALSEVRVSEREHRLADAMINRYRVKHGNAIRKAH